MGKSDTYSKDLLQDNNYFADAVNNVLFKGSVIINPNELQELDPIELTIIEDIVEESIPIQKYRDVLKQVVIREDKRAIYAIIGIENNDIQKAHNNIMKVERIIEEFQMTLNFKYPIANDFNNVYTYLLQRLREANMLKDKEILEEVNTHLRTMRDTWKEVMKTAK